MVVGAGADEVHWPSAIGLGADHTVLLPGGDADLVRVLSEIRRPVDIRRARSPWSAVTAGGASVLAAAIGLRSADDGAHNAFRRR